MVVVEVSMLDAELLDKLEEMARLMRKNGRPFGGIQIILCGMPFLSSGIFLGNINVGDFFQLPPVGLGRGKAFAFQARCWKRCLHVCPAMRQLTLLSLIFRQAWCWKLYFVKKTMLSSKC
jgi:ATP-dependent DNA helicase PIF1